MQPGDEATMAIGEIAGRFGLATHVLRHWESAGLLAPAPGRGWAPPLPRGRPVLGRDHPAKEAGLSLEQIREFMTSAVPARRPDILLHHREDLVARTDTLRESLAFIDGGLECVHKDFTACPHYQAMVRARIAPQAAPHVST